MDEAQLEKWSETLMDLRQNRLTQAQKSFEEKGGAFSPGDFFDQAIINLDTILEKWVNLEQSDWDTNPPEDPGAAIQDIRSETDSLVDLEIEAVLRDAQSLKQDANWDTDMYGSSEVAFQSAVSELRNKYQLKLNSFSGAAKKKSPPFNPTPVMSPAPSLPKTSYTGRSSGGSGSSIVLMFLVGLVLGVAPSLYFWDANNKLEKKFLSDKAKLETTQRLIEDNYAMLRDVFSQMAAGKLKSLSEMEDQLRKMRAEFSSRKKQYEKDFSDERDRLVKKYPAGGKLDQALEDMEYRKVQKMGDLREQESSDLQKLEKQIKVVKDLLAS